MFDLAFDIRGVASFDTKRQISTQTSYEIRASADMQESMLRLISLVHSTLRNEKYPNVAIPICVRQATRSCSLLLSTNLPMILSMISYKRNAVKENAAKNL